MTSHPTPSQVQGAAQVGRGSSLCSGIGWRSCQSKRAQTDSGSGLGGCEEGDGRRRGGGTQENGGRGGGGVWGGARGKEKLQVETLISDLIEGPVAWEISCHRPENTPVIIQVGSKGPEPWTRSWSWLWPGLWLQPRFWFWFSLWLWTRTWTFSSRSWFCLGGLWKWGESSSEAVLFMSGCLCFDVVVYMLLFRYLCNLCCSLQVVVVYMLYFMCCCFDIVVVYALQLFTCCLLPVVV